MVVSGRWDRGRGCRTVSQKIKADGVSQPRHAAGSSLAFLGMAHTQVLVTRPAICLAGRFRSPPRHASPIKSVAQSFQIGCAITPMLATPNAPCQGSAVPVCEWAATTSAPKGAAVLSPSMTWKRGRRSPWTSERRHRLLVLNERRGLEPDEDPVDRVSRRVYRRRGERSVSTEVRRMPVSIRRRMSVVSPPPAPLDPHATPARPRGTSLSCPASSANERLTRAWLRRPLASGSPSRGSHPETTSSAARLIC